MDLETVADELYALLPDDFIAARTEREKEAKAAGDKPLATQIHSLSKPNQVAWLANQLARQHADELTPLLELGSDLRDASDSLTGEQLRLFSRQQHQLVRALVGQARRLAQASGKKITEDTARSLQDTLHAALADPAAAERLVAGRLSAGMQHVGFGPSITVGAAEPAAPKPAAGRRRQSDAATSAKESHDRRLAQADEGLERAKEAAREAAETRDQARSDLDQAGAEIGRLAAEVARLQDELDSATAEHSRVIRDERRLRKTFDRVDKAAKDAVRRVKDAESARQRVAEQP